MTLLPSYLRKSHKYYMDDRMEHIEEHLSKIVFQLSQSAGKALTNFFSDYKRELEEHFSFEESSVSPTSNPCFQAQAALRSASMIS